MKYLIVLSAFCIFSLSAISYADEAAKTNQQMPASTEQSGHVVKEKKATTEETVKKDEKTEAGQKEMKK